MIVIADTSPLNYLVQLELDVLLSLLYENTLIPPAVLRELQHPVAPSAVREWAAHPPVWVRVQAPMNAPDGSLRALDAGESEAIRLAQENRTAYLLIDERKGRLESVRRGLATTGTLGVLIAAGESKLIDAAATYYRLIAETSFRTSTVLEERFFSQIYSPRKD